MNPGSKSLVGLFFASQPLFQCLVVVSCSDMSLKLSFLGCVMIVCCILQ